MPARFSRTLFVAAAALAAIAALAPVCGSPDEQTPVTPSPSVTSTMATPSTTPIAAPTTTEVPASTPASIGAVEPAATAESAPTPPWSSPPVAPSEDMVFSTTEVWVNARWWGGEVIAYISGVECGRRTGPQPVHVPTISVRSAAHQPGCGVPGATITFTVDGRVASTTVKWSAGLRPALMVFVGPAPSWFRGQLTMRGYLPPFTLAAYINGVRCGSTEVRLIQGDPRDPRTTISYAVSVDPAEVTPDCGTNGDQVDFHAEYHAESVDVDEIVAHGIWQAEAETEIPTFDAPASIPRLPFDPG